MDIDGAAFQVWTQGDLIRVEQLLTEDTADPSLHSLALAQRAIVRSRLKRWGLAMDDAKKVILCHPWFHAVLIVAFQVYRGSAICHWLYRKCCNPDRQRRPRVGHPCI